MKRIHDYDIFYALLRLYAVCCFKQYYRSITIKGIEHLPKEQPFILAPNHQNALMDALVVLMTQPGQPVFLARADIFKKKSISRILRFFNIMPVYRMRDGRNELDKNEAIFNCSIQVLQDGVTLCLMPEGQQSFRRTLLPLVKGMFRIAFRAQEEISAGKQVSIVPMGIDYSDYTNPGGSLIVQFGAPIPIQPLLPLYHQHPAKALNELRDVVATGIDALVQNIQSKTYYENFYTLSCMFDNKDDDNNNNPIAQLEMRRSISKALDKAEVNTPDSISRLDNMLKQYESGLKQHSIPDEALKTQQHIPSMLLYTVLLIICFPLALYGALANAIPALAPRLMLHKVKDKSFVGSFSYVLHLISFLIYPFLALGILACTPLPLWQSAIMILTWPLFGKIALVYLRKFKRVFNNWRFFIFKSKYAAQATALQTLREELWKGVRSLTLNA